MGPTGAKHGQTGQTEPNGAKHGKRGQTGSNGAKQGHTGTNEAKWGKTGQKGLTGPRRVKRGQPEQNETKQVKAGPIGGKRAKQNTRRPNNIWPKVAKWCKRGSHGNKWGQTGPKAANRSIMRPYRVKQDKSGGNGQNRTKGGQTFSAFPYPISYSPYI